MVKQFRMSGATNHPLTMHCYWRNGSPESRPHTLKDVLAPTVWGHFPLSRKRTSNPHRDQILVLEEVSMLQLSGPTSTSQSTDDDKVLRGTGWGDGGPVYLET